MRDQPPRSRRPVTGVRHGFLVSVAAAIIAGCGATATPEPSMVATATPAASIASPTAAVSPTPAPTEPPVTPAPSRVLDPDFDGIKVVFDPADFVHPTLDTNPFHPLTPGLQWVRGGTTEVGSRAVPFEVISTMTDVIRVIDGVPTIAMLDVSTDAGEIAQIGVDYFALDRDGNVWIMGGYSEDYEGGEYTNIDVAFLGNGDGAEVGILSPRNVDMATPRWFIGNAPEEDPTIGLPVEIGISACVTFGCFDGVRVVQEGAVDDPENENKYYAPGVGVINNIPLDASLHQDTFQMTNFVELSPEGLAEASQTVLDLEAHAAKVAPEVFSGAPASTRLN
jgi:hypothetical protein